MQNRETAAGQESLKRTFSKSPQFYKLTKTLFSIRLIVIFILFASGVHLAFSQENPLGQFDGHGDIGSPAIFGSASYNATNQDYTLTGGGINMWGTNDQFHFLWKKIKGDFIVRARMEFVGKGVEEHRKAGWMVRESLDSNAPYVDAVEHGVGLTSLQYRRVQGTNTAQFVMSITNADVIQFERRGSNYIFSAARHGEHFISTNFSNIALPDDAYVGLFICSHNTKVKEEVIFHDVRIIRPAKEGFVPYKDFIGSVLEILDVQSGRLEMIHRSAQPFEAPNWTRDGSALIYNISGRAEGWGRLARFDLATRQQSLIDTGFANRNNNDHILSFDGTMLGISDQSADHGGQSAVFTVPVGGGTPKQITPLMPSYLHGWSPDGKFLVYAGRRDGKFDINKIPSQGGKEIRLTGASGSSDGPEYTPDGKYIYFNSTRSGKMQIWRMKPNGEKPEQVTNDEYNNWFPHISPDGEWIEFISFPEDIDPKDHPYYKQVYLRLMPIKGGTPRIIAYVYGGQGTINVPFWSPDGRKLAFVSNTGME
jgi:Tol biopolymer transport system component/regulation of enolase protein 1 (concanavalin A-like superfamily)